MNSLNIFFLIQVTSYILSYILFQLENFTHNRPWIHIDVHF